MVIPPLFIPLLSNISRAANVHDTSPFIVLFITLFLICGIIYLVRDILRIARINFVRRNRNVDGSVMDFIFVPLGIFCVLFVNPLYLLLVWLFMSNPRE